MNGSVTLSAETSVKSGSWKTYWMNPDKQKIQSAKTATVSSGKLNMTVTIGGRYWLSTKDLRLEGTTASGPDDRNQLHSLNAGCEEPD